MSNPLEVPIILIPLIWLAATTLVVAACQVAARGEGCRASSTLGEEARDERGALDQHQAPDRIGSSQGRSTTGRERGVMIHHGR